VSVLARLKTWARALKRDVHALYLAGRDPRVPWFAKLLAIIIAAYALSPIDLIPDFIPVLGYLDDLLIVPLGIWLVVRMIAPPVMAQLRQKAAQGGEKPKSTAAAVGVVLIWIALAALTGVALWQRLAP
jgi:uncharacterized membrane protein YkvA (DUF1232 family)